MIAQVRTIETAVRKRIEASYCMMDVAFVRTQPTHYIILPATQLYG